MGHRALHTHALYFPPVSGKLAKTHSLPAHQRSPHLLCAVQHCVESPENLIRL